MIFKGKYKCFKNLAQLIINHYLNFYFIVRETYLPNVGKLNYATSAYFSLNAKFIITS